MEPRPRVLTGIRPPGPLHLGHYAGALETWRSLQSRYDCQFLIADYQVSDYADDVRRVREAERSRARRGQPGLPVPQRLQPRPRGGGGSRSAVSARRRRDVEVKDKLATALDAFLEPIRERRAHFAANMGRVRDAVADGTARARESARATMALVRDALDLGYLDKFRAD